MKKTVQIVTLPLNKEGWNKDALIKRQPPQITQYMISDKFSNAITESIWQSQQLLVLSDDVILSGNKFVWLDGLDQGVYTAIPMEDYIGRGEIPVGLIGETGRKVIASYPQLEGTLSYPNIETLSISKETVQAWIDAGTPGEGSVTIDKEFDDWYELMELKSYPNWKPVVDPQGNLLLDFGNQIDRNYPEEYELTQEEAKEWCESIQPSVDSIEEAVEKYRNQWKTGDKFDDIDTEDKAYNAGENYRNGYKDGWEANPVNKQVELYEQFIKEKHLSIAYYNWLEEKKDNS